jgi:endonuclease/exonuclease/phosphatase family metal-dependent hydrolase
MRIASWNLRALMRPGYTPWPDQAPYTESEYRLKQEFLVQRLRSFQAQIVGVQEVAEPEAFEELQQCLQDIYPHLAVGARGEGSGLRVGVLSTWPVAKIRTHWDIPPEGRIRLVPEGEVIVERFRRPVLSVELDMDGSPLTLVNVHLKAKRPDFFPSEEPRRGEESEPISRARAMGRSLVVRAAEASGLRALVRELQLQSKGPVVLLGDFNDGPQSVTTQILGKAPPLHRSLRQDEFYSTLELGRRRNPQQRIHTHIWEGNHEVLDHIVVSGDLGRRFEALECTNDFLPDAPQNTTLSDHGALVAEFRPAS